MKSAKTICILGRQPALGLAELESLYGAGHVQPIGEVAAGLDLPPEEIDFGSLGGSIKLAKVLTRLPHDWPRIQAYLTQQLPRHLRSVPAIKFNLGLSVYGLNIPAAVINKDLIKLKQTVRSQTGRAIRTVPNKTSALSSAQVLHNKLLGETGWELVLVRDGEQTLLAQTLAIQDISGYAARDQARPKRDAKVGMLPPKLAQIIINLTNPRRGATVLDPFCGTGVILQEAMLMGYDVIGTDNDPRMVDFARENLEWLQALQPNLSGSYQIEIGDATSFTWPSAPITIASEIYLGPPLTRPPGAGQLNKIVAEVDQLLSGFLQNLYSQLPDNNRVCLAVPAWRTNRGWYHLGAIAKLEDLGYNRLSLSHVATGDLVYFRPGQIVARELLILEKK